MIRLISIQRLLKPLLLVLLLPNVAVANQLLEVNEGQPAYAKISSTQLTRLKIIDGRIENIRGNQGEIIIEPDSSTGEAYLRPAAGGRIINLFVTSDSGRTYTLLLSPEPIPATSIVLKELSRVGSVTALTNSSNYEKTLKNIILSMAREDQPQGYDIQSVGRRMPMWKGTNFVLEKKYVGQEFVGEKYTLTNKGENNLVVAEPEFYKNGTLAVSIENMQIPKDASTNVYIVRRRANNE